VTERPDQDETTAGESYGDYSVDDEDQPQGEGDSLTDDRGLRDPLDEGYSPPERWSAGQGYGNTPLEEELGESLDQRLAQEEQETDPYVAAATEDEDLDDREVGHDRAGRLVAEDQGLGEDTEKDLVAEDIGVDGAGASAEEAAVHVVDEDE
jgi:hypothetical protein